MRLTLADHVHGGVVDGDLVMLDVQADVYFCLPAGDYRVAVSGRGIDAEPPALAEALCDAGLVTRAFAAAAPSQEALAPPKRTARALLDADPALKAAPVRWRHLVALFVAARGARDAERTPFADRLARPLPTSAKASTSQASIALLADVAVFRRLVPWLPLDGRCLFWSQILRLYLAALGHRVSWRFGVRTWPFRAHCWLQADDVALDDEAERLAAFHQILAV